MTVRVLKRMKKHPSSAVLGLGLTLAVVALSGCQGGFFVAFGSGSQNRSLFARMHETGKRVRACTEVGANYEYFQQKVDDFNGEFPPLDNLSKAWDVLDDRSQALLEYHLASVDYLRSALAWANLPSQGDGTEMVECGQISAMRGIQMRGIHKDAKYMCNTNLDKLWLDASAHLQKADSLLGFSD